MKPNTEKIVPKSSSIIVEAMQVVQCIKAKNQRMTHYQNLHEYSSVTFETHAISMREQEIYSTKYGSNDFFQ